MTWGSWKSWDPTTATEPPPDIFPPGTVVQADTMIRPEWIGRIDRPHFLEADEFPVITGESWVLDWPRPDTTHVVVRYRVRGEEQNLVIECSEEVNT